MKGRGKHSGPGRPRDEEVERRILQTALRHLSEYGYSRMSMDQVAEEAGTGKPTIYRRWPSKADLATAALRTLQLAEPAPATGSPRQDLTLILRQSRRSLLRPNGMSLIGTVLAEEPHNPELLRLFRQRIVAPRRRMIRDAIDRAKASGEIRGDVDGAVVAAMLVGSFYAAYLASPSVPADLSDRLVRLLWDGIGYR